MIRKYHLEGFFIMLLILALLFIWKSATSLMPRREDTTIENSEEWRKSFAHLQKDDPEAFKGISKVIQVEKTFIPEAQFGEGLSGICQILARKH